MENDNRHLFNQVNDIDAQIASLKKKKEELLSHVSAQEFQTASSVNSINNLSAAHEKIALFRSLFRGREDVFALITMRY